MFSPKFFSVLFALLFLALPNAGSSQTFKFTKMPAGVITASMADRQGNLYIGVPNGGVYRSTDSGGTWSRLSLSTLTSSAVYALGTTRHGRPVVCTDGGGIRILQPSNVWTPFNTGLPTGVGLPNIRAFTCDSAGHYFAGTRSGNLAPTGLFFAADTGASWSDISATLPSKEILALITGPDGTVYCGVDGFGVYTWNGSVWSPLNTNLADLHTHCFTFDAKGNLLAGTDKGISILRANTASWVNHSVGTMPVLSLAADPTNGARIIAGLGHTQYQAGALRGRIYLSNDTGATWTDAAPSLATLRVRTVTIAPSGIMIAGAQGIYRSSDHGATWSAAVNGFKDGIPAAVGGGFAATPKHTFVVGSEYGLFRSTDQGVTWNEANSGLRHPLVEFVYCDSLGYLFACAHALPRHESSLNRLYRSTDDGLTWDTVKISLTGIYSMIAPGRNGDLFLAHGFGAQPPSATIVGSSCARSTDHGATWFDLPCLGGGKGFAVGMTKKGTLLFGGETLGLFRSTDNGASWDTTIHVGPGGNMAPVCVSPRGEILTCAYGDNRIWFSDSASDGTAWTNMTSPSFPLYTSASTFTWSSTGRTYVGLKGNPPNTGLYYIDGPLTAGSTFVPVPGAFFNASKFHWDDNGYLWAYGSGSLVRSDSVLTAPRTVTAAERTPSAPSAFGLEQNYPNPFNPATAIRYQLSERGATSLRIYDALGRQAAELVNEVKEPGAYTVQFNASALASGVYLYTLRSGNFVQTRRMQLIK